MFIKRSEYIELLNCKDMNIELEKEIKRLEFMLNTKDKTCKIGPWCCDCEHWVEDSSLIVSNEDILYDDVFYGFSLPKKIGGKIGYCNKNIHIMCEDFKRKLKN